MSHGRIAQGVGPQGSVRAIQMRSQVSTMMVNAPRDLCWLLVGPWAYMAEGNPKGMGPDESLDSLADHGIGLERSRLESHS